MQRGARQEGCLAIIGAEISEYEVLIQTSIIARISFQLRVNQAAREALEYYFSRARISDGEESLLRSLRSNRPLDRIRANTLVNRWCREVGLQGKFGTHSLRKTWGYRARKIGVPIELIQEKLGHRSPAVTRRYIGVTQDEVNNIEEKVCL